MHDIDRTQLEYDVHEAEHFEFGHEGEAYHAEGESPFSEAEEMELAAELLGVTTEAELDHFLGGLIKRAGQAVGSFVRSPLGRQLGGALKGIASKALPIAGRALGTYFGGPAGGQIGSQLASGAGRLFGLELEGMSHEEAEFEVAKSFVRLAGAAAKDASLAPPTASPQAAAQAALTSAAQQHAPGLLRGGPGVRSGPGGRKRSGRWVRRGGAIVVIGA